MTGIRSSIKGISNYKVAI